MSAMKRFNEDISCILGELGYKDVAGDKYTGQSDDFVFDTGGLIDHAIAIKIVMEYETNPEALEQLHQQLDGLLGTEDTFLHKVFLKYQALEAEREAKSEQEVLSRENCVKRQ